MIVVKLKQTLRIASDKVGSRLIPVGSIFRADNYEEFPEWLRKEIKYFKGSLTCDTLLIKEMSLNVQDIAPKGKLTVDVKVKAVKKKIEVEKIKDAPKKEQPTITLNKRKK